LKFRSINEKKFKISCYLSLAIGEELESKKVSFDKKKLQNLSILFYYIVPPSNVASNLRLYVRLAACQNDATVLKRKTLRAHPRYSITHSSKRYHATLARTIMDPSTARVKQQG